MTEAAANLLPLESFRQLMNLHPYHFWGLAGSAVPEVTGCPDVLREYGWQRVDAIGRQTIREAIITAERRLREYLGFDVAPVYREHTLHYPRPYDASLEYARAAGSDGRWLSVQLPDGHVQALGIESATLLASSAVAYTSVYNGVSGPNDTFTVTATVPSGTTADEVAVYIPAAERTPTNAARSERWRVAPVAVAISGTTATITGGAWLLVRPRLYQGVSTEPIDPGAAGTFLTTLEVYRRRTNGDGTTTATAQGVLTWESSPWPSWATCCAGAGDAASVADAVARVGIRDARAGLVIPGEAAYNAAAGTWAGIAWDGCHQPDRVTVRYLAGAALEGGQMASMWAETVARFAAAELQRPLCACDTASAQLNHWQTDLARTGGNAGEQYGAISATDLDNPFGTRRGHVHAWRNVRNVRQLRGFTP